MIHLSALALGLLAVGFGAPQHASVNLQGTVPAVCTLSGSTAADDDGTLETHLSVFCNQREGSTVTGTVTGNDPLGYLVRFDGRTIHVESGVQFEVARYSDAYIGFQALTITPASGEADSVPAVTFDINTQV